jgi:hypothetical protein
MRMRMMASTATPEASGGEPPMVVAAATQPDQGITFLLFF